MSLLRKALLIQAAIWGLAGLVLAIVPGWTASVVGFVDPPEHVWMRLAGINLLVIAMLLVLVARRLEQVWWWAWAFVIGDLLTASFLTLKSAFGMGSGAWGSWWILAGIHFVLAALLAVGLARAGQERIPE